MNPLLMDLSLDSPQEEEDINPITTHPNKPEGKDCGPEATFRKYKVLFKIIEGLRVKEKREIFKLMRTGTDVCERTFLPHYGITVGEFAVFIS